MWAKRQAKPQVASSAAAPVPKASSSSSSSVFASRRSSAAATTASSGTKSPTSSLFAPRRAATTAASTGAPSSGKHSAAAADDCSWLLRALDKKKKKHNKPVEVSDATSPHANSISNGGGTAKKRPLSNPTTISTTSSQTASAGGDESSEHARKKSNHGGLKSSWKQRQQAWQTPMLQQKQERQAQVTREKELNVVESERQESFDQVYLEVFGRQEQQQKAQAKAAAQPAGFAIGALVEPCSSATERATQRAEALSTTSTAAVATPSSKWGFRSSSAISLDDFDVPKSAETATNAFGNNVSSNASSSAHEFARWKDDNARHAVSDNFVKLHMRKRVKGSSGKAKKLPAYLRARHGGGAYDGADADGSSNTAFMDPLANASRDKANNQFQQSQPMSGFMNDGVDFIEECLEVLARVESQHGGGRNASRSAATQSEGAPEEEMQPPRCHHALHCSKVVVKKKNKNHGRVFFSCPLGFEEGRCDFFLWEDNHTQLALHTLLATQTEPQADLQDATIGGAHPEYVPLDLSLPVQEQEDALVTNLRLVFGHPSFRQGQQWAITRIFQQKNTLLVLPTGAGKSLCYQYPAVFLPGVTIVISPLISLMNDQFQNLPPLLKAHAACLASSSNSKAKYAEFVRDLLGGKLKLVFLSPEKAVSNGFQQLLFQIRSRISLVCVDEAHCISEWSHHFRPSYLRLQTIFQYAQCVLAITATASNRVIDDILSQFHGDAEMVLQMPWQRANLELQVRRVVSNDERIQHLVRFLSTTKLQGGTIMYVHQQRQAEDMATVLKEQLPGGSTWTKKIAYYHAKMDTEAKEKVRTGFISGRIRVVIATIAFGMGIDKQNVRCVIHFHMPSSVENYLQQIGRAGRDGKPAMGMLYLLPDDVQTFRSLAFTNAFHKDQLRALVTRVLLAGENGAASALEEDDTYKQHIVAVRESGDHDDEPHEKIHVTMAMEWLESYLDMKAATIETFLTLMALKKSEDNGHDDTLMKLQWQPSSMSVCIIHVMEKRLRDVPSDAPLKRIVAAIQARQVTHGRMEKETNGYLSMVVIEFHVREMAQCLFSHGVAHSSSLSSSGSVHERKLLQAVRKMQQDGLIQRFTLEKQAFRIDLEWKKQLTRVEKQALVVSWTQQLYSKHLGLEAMEVKRLTRLYGALHASSLPCRKVKNQQRGGDDLENDDEEEEEQQFEKAQVLEDKLVQYFEQEHVSPEDDALMKQLLQPLTPKAIDAIERDVRSLVQLAVFEGDGGEDEDGGDEFGRPTGYKNKKNCDKKQTEKEKATQMAKTQWTCYSVAKVFHGIASPCFPSTKWRDHVCWKRYDGFAFEQLVKIAEKVLEEETITTSSK